MSGAHRAWQEWIAKYVEDGGDLPAHQDDLEEAFIDGWNSAMTATWEPGGQLAHPGAPKDLCQSNFLDASVDCDLPSGHEGDHIGSIEWESQG